MLNQFSREMEASSTLFMGYSPFTRCLRVILLDQNQQSDDREQTNQRFSPLFEDAYILARRGVRIAIIK